MSLGMPVAGGIALERTSWRSSLPLNLAWAASGELWHPLSGTGLHLEVQDSVACPPWPSGRLCWRSWCVDACPGSLSQPPAPPCWGLFDISYEQQALMAAITNVGSTPFWDPYCQTAGPEARRKDAQYSSREETPGCLGSKSLEPESHVSEYREMRCCWSHPQKDSNPVSHFLPSLHPLVMDHAQALMPHTLWARFACVWITILKAQEMLFLEGGRV